MKFKDNDGGSSTSSSYSSQPSPDIAIQKKDENRIMNRINEPIHHQQMGASLAESHLLHNVSSSSSHQAQLNQIPVTSHNAANILSSHFRNTLKNQNNSSVAAAAAAAAVAVAAANSTPSNNNSALHSHLTQQLAAQQQIIQQQQQQQHLSQQLQQQHQQQQQQNKLLALAAQNNRPDLQIKLPYNRNNNVIKLN